MFRYLDDIFLALELQTRFHDIHHGTLQGDGIFPGYPSQTWGWDFIYRDLYYKPTDSHSYQLYSSAHPHHCKKSIPYTVYSQFLQIKHTVSKTLINTT